MLQCEIPLVGNGGTVVRIGEMDANTREAGCGGGGDRLRGTGHSARTGSQSREAPIEEELIGRNGAVRTRGVLSGQVDIPWRVRREPVVFASAFLEARSAESGANYGL